jgi:hypothetical protein
MNLTNSQFSIPNSYPKGTAEIADFPSNEN